MKNFIQALLTMAVTTAFAIGASQAPATAPTAKDTAKTATTTAAKPVKEHAAKAVAPTAAEIADAKTKSLVWVNLNTKVFHKDGALYGKTKNGKFMAEADAVKAGFHAAKEPKVKTTAATKPATTPKK